MSMGKEDQGGTFCGDSVKNDILLWLIGVLETCCRRCSKVGASCSRWRWSRVSLYSKEKLLVMSGIMVVFSGATPDRGTK